MSNITLLGKAYTYHSLLTATLAKVQLPCFPVEASSIWLMARLRRPFAANKSVLVVDAGVKADAADATKMGAKDWKRILKKMDRSQKRSDCVDPRKSWRFFSI